MTHSWSAAKVVFNYKTEKAGSNSISLKKSIKMKVVFVVLFVGVFAHSEIIDPNCLDDAIRLLCATYHKSAFFGCYKWQEVAYEATTDTFHIRGYPSKTLKFIYKR